MNEQKLMNLMDSLTVKQTDILLKGVEIEADCRTNRRVLKKTKEKINGTHKKSKLWLIPVAACACALAVTFTAFPETADAVKAFFQKAFSLSSYMGTPQEQRVTVPEVEQAIQHPEPAEQFEIQLGEEMANWGEISAAREEFGFSPFDAEAFAWLKEIKPEVKEVLFDGSNIVVTGFVATDNPLPFFASSMEAPDASQRVSLVGAVLEYEEAGQQMQVPGVCNLQLDGEASSLSESDGMRIANEDYILAQGGVPFMAEFRLADENTFPGLNIPESLPEGMLEATMSVEINDDTVDDMSTVGVIGKAVFDVSFDTSEGSRPAQPQLDTQEGQAHAITGRAVTTLVYDDNFTFGNRELSYDGVEITIDKVESSLDRVKVCLTQTLPEGWDEETRAAYIAANTEYRLGLNFLAMVDGEEWGHGSMTLTGTEGGKYQYEMEIPVMGAGINKLEILPVVEWFEAIDGEAIPLGDKKAFGLAGKTSWGADNKYTELGGNPITIIGS